MFNRAPVANASCLYANCEAYTQFPVWFRLKDNTQTRCGVTMKRTLMLSVALLFGASLATAQRMPLEGFGAKNTAAAPAESAYRDVELPRNPEVLDVPRIEIFASSSLVIPAPSWGLPSNTHGIGFDASTSINLNRWL